MEVIKTRKFLLKTFPTAAKRPTTVQEMQVPPPFAPGFPGERWFWIETPDPTISTPPTIRELKVSIGPKPTPT
jgi:hypothetical protein